MARKWGQHFLIRQGVVEKMLKHAVVREGDTVIEIGPGRGFLTRSLLSRGARVQAVEVDQTMCAGLRERFGDHPGFTLLEGDVMEIEPGELLKVSKDPLKIVANLPYRISASLILRLIPFRRQCASMTLMVQQEVADRICAEPGNRKHYGALSLASGMAFECRKILTVQPAAFRPPPKVSSAVIHLLPRNSGLDSGKEKMFLQWSHSLFGSRRKTLVNNIRQHYPGWHNDCEVGLKKTLGLRRPEDLSLQEWLSLFREYILPQVAAC